MKAIYALRKEDLAPESLQELLDLQRLRERVWDNLALVEQELDRTPHARRVRRLRRPGTFTFDGSISLSVNHDLRFPEFFDERRATLLPTRRILRGARYLASIDPTLEVRQKLLILREDFVEALQVVSRSLRTRSRGFEGFLEVSGALDYAKNAAITILNALILPEKQGEFRVSDVTYQEMRDQAVATATAATRTYYGHLLGWPHALATGVQAMHEQLPVLDAVVRHIEKAYLEGSFSSRFFTRPEAGHPLVLGASAVLACQTAPSPPDVIVGLPSGATELAILQQYAFDILRKATVPLILVPYSLHSVKRELDGAAAAPVESAARYLAQVAEGRSIRHALLVEDNSSTGRTVQSMVAAMSTAWPQAETAVSVAEADLIRSALDRSAPHRTHIASQETHRRAINVLPVSRRLAPKVDLKELAERRRLAGRYRKLLVGAKREADVIQFRVFLRLIQEPRGEVADLHAYAGAIVPPQARAVLWNPVPAMRKHLREQPVIADFTNTFLSNFYITPVAIVYGGTEYPSVEHAYQSQKFHADALARVTPEDVRSIHDLMNARGHKWDGDDVARMFRDARVSAGSVKRIAEYLRGRGYVRKDWDDIKVQIMIELLLQKFRQPRLRAELTETRGKYLIEGNTWRDTLWGVYRGRGRNLLGLILMEIRDYLQPEAMKAG